MTRPFRRLSLAFVCLFLASVATPIRADVVPGDVITEANIDKVKDLVSPGLESMLPQSLIVWLFSCSVALSSRATA
jgi:hypothetical protein